MKKVFSSDSDCCMSGPQYLALSKLTALRPRPAPLSFLGSPTPPTNGQEIGISADFTLPELSLTTNFSLLAAVST